MDFKGFKKIHEDDNKAIMEHPKGHQITIAKHGLSYKLRRHLKELPLQLKDGGEVSETETPLGAEEGVAAGAANSAPVQLSQAIPPTPQITPAPQEAVDNAAQDADWQGMQAQQQPLVLPPGTDVSQFPGLEEDRKAIALKQRVEGVEAQKTAAIQQSQLKQELNLANQQNEYRQSLHSDMNQLTQDILNHQINPKDYMESKDGLGKAQTAIGLLLGGIGSGLAGGPNIALEFLNKQIDRNIEAQKANLGVKHNLLSALHQQYGDSFVAENMAKATLANVTAHQIQIEANKLGTVKAQQAAMAANSALLQKYGPLFNSMSSRLLVQNASGQPGQGQSQSQVDPASLIPHLMDPSTGKPISDTMKEKIADEVGKAQNLKQNESAILDAFQKARQENSLVGRASRLGFEGPAVKGFKALIDSQFKDKEGRYNEKEAAHIYDLVHGPFTFKKSTDDANLATLQGWLESKKATPLAKSAGLDLDKFQSTRPADVMVSVVSPQGITGKVKQSELKNALSQGYKQK